MNKNLYLLGIFFLSTVANAATSVITYDNDVSKKYISEVSDDGSTITEKVEIDFSYDEDRSFIDYESGKIFFAREYVVASDSAPGGFETKYYYYVYDPVTGTFSGSAGDGNYEGYLEIVTWNESISGINGTGNRSLLSAITSNKSSAQTNASNISTNTNNISTNADDIATNKTNIAKNADDIATNKTNIAKNADDIATNKTNIAKNADDIATNKTNIAKNADDIATNKTNIATNATNIATNATNVATNKSNIETNALGIANNSVRIDNLAALVNSNVNRIEGLETLTGLMRNEYRTGIASSIALSQIQYASDGFSIGVGHGEFKDKDEMAVGIGYGGQFNEKVGYQFQFGSSGDSTGFGFTIRF